MIGDCAFNGCHIEEATIPSFACVFIKNNKLNTVVITSGDSIDEYAFGNCSNLTSVTISDSVTVIASNAFYNCKNLTSITIPDSITSIGESAFSGCSSLESITLPFIGDSKDITTNDIYHHYPFGYIFGTNSYKGGIKTEQYYKNWTTTSTRRYYYIPSTLKSVTITCGDVLYGAFYNCNNLTSVILGNGVISIGDYAFYGCSSLQSVTIGDGVTSIGQSAFAGCNKLTNITIPNGVISVGTWAFSGCSSLKYNEFKNAYYLGNDNNPYLVLVKVNDTSITSITINDNTKVIANYAFEDCSSITNITIPDKVTSISYQMFYGCSSLTNITMYESVTSIGAGAFYGCSSLTNIIIGKGVTSIGEEAFYGCIKLTSITIPDSITSIGADAFKNCSIEKATIPASAISHIKNDKLKTVVITSGDTIGDSAFQDCTNLTSLSIPDSITSIGSSAFYCCNSLTSIAIPNSVTSIGRGAFDGCRKLQSITIGNGVTSIGDYAFYNCYDLSIVYYKGTESDWSSINIGTYNNCLTDATRYYYSETYKAGNYWHYDENGNIEEWANHTHIGTNPVVTAPTCTEEGYTTYTCALCGDTYIDDDTPAKHNYNYTVTAPTCTEKGYTTYTCTECGDSYVGDYVSAKHNYVDGVCSLCGKQEVVIEEATGLEYALSDDETYYIVTGLGTEARTEFKIPSSYNGKPVKEIGERAFAQIDEDGYYLDETEIAKIELIVLPDTITTIGGAAFVYCVYLKEITIPTSVTTIGSQAFEYCISLESITIPASVATIGSQAFEYCISLESITIPASVTSIGVAAFAGCVSLESITVEKENTVYKSAGNCIIEIATKTLISGCKTSVIPTDGSVTSIANYTFYYCSSLQSITIPSSVTSIGKNAFFSCNDLTSVTIPDSVTSIGAGAFEYCYNLTSVTIGSGVTSIGEEAFAECYKLVEVINKSSLDIAEDSDETGYVAYYAFNVKTEGTSDIVNVNDYLFYTYGNVNYLLGYVGDDTELVLPDKYNGQNYEIYKYAFYGCSSLQSVTIGSGVTSIGGGAFFGCSSLQSVTIGSGVTVIGYYVFADCDNLTTINYNGAKANWNAIEKTMWNAEMPECTLICTDGSFKITSD